MVAILVTDCYGKALVAMASHYGCYGNVPTEVNGCFGKSLLAMESHCLLIMEVTGCYGKLVIAMEVNDCYGK
jgi:hypothetical protein